MRNLGILGLVLGGVAAITTATVVAKKRHNKKQVETSKPSKQAWAVAGIEFDSYYIARSYAKDNGIALTEVQPLKG